MYNPILAEAMAKALIQDRLAEAAASRRVPRIRRRLRRRQLEIGVSPGMLSIGV